MMMTQEQERLSLLAEIHSLENEIKILQSKIECGQVLYDALVTAKDLIHDLRILDTINNALQQWDGGKYK